MSIQGNINQALGIGAGLVSAKKIASAKAAKIKATEAKAAETPVTPATEAKAAETPVTPTTEAKAAEKKSAGVHLKRIKKRLRRMQKANEQAQIRQEVKMAQKSIIETNINKWGSL